MSAPWLSFSPSRSQLELIPLLKSPGRRAASTAQGADGFQGRIVHARDFTDLSAARGKEVVVVGAGKTGAYAR